MKDVAPQLKGKPRLEKLVGMTIDDALLTDFGLYDYTPIVRVPGYSNAVFVHPIKDDEKYMGFYNCVVDRYHNCPSLFPEEERTFRIRLNRVGKDNRGILVGHADFLPDDRFDRQKPKSKKQKFLY